MSNKKKSKRVHKDIDELSEQEHKRTRIDVYDVTLQGSSG